MLESPPHPCYSSDAARNFTIRLGERELIAQLTLKITGEEAR